MDFWRIISKVDLQRHVQRTNPHVDSQDREHLTQQVRVHLLCSLLTMDVSDNEKELIQGISSLDKATY